jgi:hypothetical protein
LAVGLSDPLQNAPPEQSLSTEQVAGLQKPSEMVSCVAARLTRLQAQMLPGAQSASNSQGE